MAGLASRSIFFVELVSPLRFVYKALASRWDVREISDIAIEAMEAGLPRGRLLGRIRRMRDDVWAKKVYLATPIYICLFVLSSFVLVLSS